MNQPTEHSASSAPGPLVGVRVVDLSTEIAGPFSTKLLVDAGADVVKVEPADGDPLRRWTAAGAWTADSDGALFQYLNAGKRSVTGEYGDPQVQALLQGCDILIESGQLDLDQLERIRRDRPAVVVVSLSPFGRRSPWAGRPATEFTLQAWCGSTASRGYTEREPVYAGGRLGEWMTGLYAAPGALALLHGAGRFGVGGWLDISMLECMSLCMGWVTGALQESMGDVRRVPSRIVEVPSVEPTRDGWVGFCPNTGQQFQDFLAMIERPDLVGKPEYATFVQRAGRREEFTELVQAWTRARTTDEIVELAALLRIPVSPIGTPETIPAIDQFVERGIYTEQPGAGFLRPLPPYLIDGVRPKRVAPAPSLGEHDGAIRWDPRARREPAPPTLPLDDLRVVDFTFFWAGPAVTQALAWLGADVVKVESIQRPDGGRMWSFKRGLATNWWEWSATFQNNNINKRGITLDMTREAGRELALALIDNADVVIENFTPRVMAQFGLTWDVIHARNPRAIMVRMPAFGLTGPWSDRVGFAQTMEQGTGMAWSTGYADAPPLIPRGPCDPIASLHAATALLACLHERERTGEGRMIEVSMAEAALNVTAEVVVEHSAYGRSVERAGNRGSVAAPQGVYACRGSERWLALAVVDDEQWLRLVDVLGTPAWAQDPEFKTLEGRRARHDELDARLAEWASPANADELVDRLLRAGVPAARVLEPFDVVTETCHRERGYFHEIDSASIGRHVVQGLPLRPDYWPGPWLRRPTPSLGEHNADVLIGELGLSEEAFQQLVDSQVIGDIPIV